MEVQALMVTTPSVYLLWIVAMGGKGTQNRGYESRLHNRIIIKKSEQDCLNCFKFFSMWGGHL